MKSDRTRRFYARLPVSVVLLVAYILSLPHFFAGLVAATALAAGDHQVLSAEVAPGTQIILHHSPRHATTLATHHHTLLTRTLVCWSLDAPTPGEPDHVFLFQKSHLALLATDSTEKFVEPFDSLPVSHSFAAHPFLSAALDCHPPLGCFAASRWRDVKNPELLALPRLAHRSIVLVI